MARRILGGVAAMCVGVALAAPRPAQAVVKAFDSAADPAYAAAPVGEVAAWRGLNPSATENPAGNDNGGFGFLPWDFGGGYYPTEDYSPQPYGNVNHFIDGVDFPASAFNNLGGPAFGLTNPFYPYDGPTTTATRPFADAMAVGDKFSVEIDTPQVFEEADHYMYPFSSIVFLNAAGQETFLIECGATPKFQDFGNDYGWRYTQPNGTKVGTGQSAYVANDGSSLSLTLTSATTADVVLDGLPLSVGLRNGVPKSVLFYVYDNTSGDGGNPNETGANPTGEREFFFDNLKIESAATDIPGDFNHNGGVGSADLGKWRTDFGVNNGSNADGDSDSDGADYLIWQRNFGMGTGGGLGATATPEPTSAWLAIMAWALPRRRRTSGA